LIFFSSLPIINKQRRRPGVSLPFHLRKYPMAKKSSILVVDDEDALRTVLGGELASEGYEVRTAADGDEAITELDKAPFDLVLLDIKMPRLNGFEVLKFIKEKHEKTKVVMLTGFADLKNAIESKKLGADDFVSKPYDLVDLLTTIERVLSE
jgi:DNA-binding NtrC family response regulator